MAADDEVEAAHGDGVEALGVHEAVQQRVDAPGREQVRLARLDDHIGGRAEVTCQRLPAGRDLRIGFREQRLERQRNDRGAPHGADRLARWAAGHEPVGRIPDQPDAAREQGPSHRTIVNRLGKPCPPLRVLRAAEVLDAPADAQLLQPGQYLHRSRQRVVPGVRDEHDRFARIELRRVENQPLRATGGDEHHGRRGGGAAAGIPGRRAQRSHGRDVGVHEIPERGGIMDLRDRCEQREGLRCVRGG